MVATRVSRQCLSPSAEMTQLQTNSQAARRVQDVVGAAAPIDYLLCCYNFNACFTNGIVKRR